MFLENIPSHMAGSSWREGTRLIMPSSCYSHDLCNQWIHGGLDLHVS